MKSHPPSVQSIPLRARKGSQLPEPWRNWLFDESSLTARLLQACGGDLRVRVLGQGWRRPTRFEAAQLGIAPRQLALVREVELLCHGQPCVFARSVIPRRTLTGPLRRLKNWDNRPLGAFLFRQPCMRRHLVAVGQFRHARYPRPAWSRSSLFNLGGKSLLITESFLALPETLAPNSTIIRDR